MKRVVALAPGLAPLSGEPKSAAPLERAMTVLCGARGRSSASRIQWNACRTSTSQLRLNVSQVWCWSGRISGEAPALSTSVFGRCCSRSEPAKMGSATSAVTVVSKPPSSSHDSASRCGLRSTATTLAPAARRATVVARPKPLLAPVTNAVVPVSSCDATGGLLWVGRGRLAPPVDGYVVDMLLGRGRKGLFCFAGGWVVVYELAAATA